MHLKFRPGRANAVLATMISLALVSTSAGFTGPVLATPVVVLPDLSPEQQLLHLINQETGVSTRDTSLIVQNIQSVVADCKRYDPVYRVDCLAQGLKDVASRIPADGDYSKARRIISKAAGDLAKLVRANADSSQPKLDAPATANPRLKRKRSYTAVKKEALAAVMKQAQAIVKEAATELLRSYENSDKRFAHYQKIATAVDSTKVLLRS